MHDPDFPISDLTAWAQADLVTIREAACLLDGINPIDFEYNHKSLPKDADIIRRNIERAILLGNLAAYTAFKEWSDINGYGTTRIDPCFTHEQDSLADCTTIRATDLVA